MKVVIVFESMFGNTAALAGEVMAGLVDADADVALAGVESAAEQVLQGCDLLVLAAPTHALTLSRPESRAEAVRKGGDLAHSAVGLREWLITLVAALPPTAPPPSIALFDTRVMKARILPGSAARSAARILWRSGYAVVDRETFYVEGIAGPVCAGEHDRARSWGRGLASSVRPGQVSTPMA